MRSRSLTSLSLATVLAFTCFIPAAHAAVQDRLERSVSGSRVSVPGTVSSRAKRATDLGAVAESRQLQSLSLRFNMTAAQQADLAQLQAAQLNPASPSYHQWLTPEQYGARFGLSSGDLAKVTSWLMAQGFTVTTTARSSTFIQFSGTAGLVEHAFGTTLHTVSANGEQHFSNLTDPALPSGLAAVVSSITGLNDFRPKPHSRSLFTQTVNGQVSHYIAPQDLYTIYDFPNAYNPHFNGSAKYDGTGVTIAVMGQSDLTSANTLPDPNIAAFRTAAGLPVINMTQQLTVQASLDPGVQQGDVDEAHLDVEWSSAAAPGAHILYVYGPDVFENSLTYAIDNKVAPIVTVSYGNCESDFGVAGTGTGPASLSAYNTMLAQANVQGMTVVASSGDSGAADCDISGPATEGINVDFPASSPFVTAAGGTQFSADVSSPGNYWNANNSSSNGSATQYIPEQAWNETTVANGLSDGGSGGGGASAFFTKPSWQTGTGVPNDSVRDVPDISLNAAANHDGYMICTAYTGVSGDLACSNGFVTSNGYPNVFGGTSFVAPITAGVLAVLEQKLGTGSTAATGLGNVNPTLYGLANGPNAASIFHDITSGNNSIECSQGTPQCQNGGQIGFSAGPGYDQATGLGSYDVNNLISNWASATPAGTGGSTNGSCNPSSPTAGTGSCISTTSVTTSAQLCAITSGSLSLTVTVAGTISGTAPTGTVQFYVDTTAVGPAQPLAGGSVTYSLATTSVSSGGHQISALYSGDVNYAGSKGTLLNPTDGTLASVDIVSPTNDFSITPCSGSIKVLPGATAAGVVFTITPTSGFAGAVNMTVTNNSSMTATTSFTLTPVTITGSGAVNTSFVLVASQTTTSTADGRHALPRSNGRTPWYAAGSGATIAGLLLLTVPRRRRWSALLVVMLSIAALTAAGCGSNSVSNGGGSGGGTTTGTTTTVNATPGIYTFTITGVSQALVHSAQVTVTVPCNDGTLNCLQ